MEVTLDAIRVQDLEGRRVLVRVDGASERALQESVPTLKYLSKSKARTVVATHYAPSFDARAELSRLLDHPVRQLADWRGDAGFHAVARLSDGEIAIIENLASFPGEIGADEGFAELLMPLGDIFCNEAFTLSHEVRASTIAVAKKARLAVAGLAFQRELTAMREMLHQPAAPVWSLLGGELTTEKLLLAEDIARRSDRILVAGQLALPFLTLKGALPPAPPVIDEMLPIAERMMKYAESSKRFIDTPFDFVVVDKARFERLKRGERFVVSSVHNVPVSDLKLDHIICDIGELTRWDWNDRLASAETIFWHGPVGICEMDLFCEGTRFLLDGLVTRGWMTVHRHAVCGDSLVAALRRIRFPIGQIGHLTRAGMVALHYFGERPLPAVDVLYPDSGPELPCCRVLIPLNGSDTDIRAVQSAAASVSWHAEFILLHVRSGIDEESYPDLMLALDDLEKFKRRVESERIFAQANAVLASHGLISTAQIAAQGRPGQVIRRYAERLGATLVVSASEVESGNYALLLAR